MPNIYQIYTTNTVYFGNVLETQKLIRAYFAKHQYRLNFKKEGYYLTENLVICFPTFFFLLLCFVADMDRCFCIEDLFKQIDTYENKYLVNECADDEEKNECVCSHSCKSNNLF